MALPGCTSFSALVRLSSSELCRRLIYFLREMLAYPVTVMLRYMTDVGKRGHTGFVNSFGACIFAE